VLRSADHLGQEAPHSRNEVSHVVALEPIVVAMVGVVPKFLPSGDLLLLQAVQMVGVNEFRCQR
jgi:hypothetical protein